MKWWAAIAIGLMVVPAAWAQTPDRGVSVGNGFYYRCNVPADHATGLLCLAYMRGLTDSLMEKTFYLVCVPPAATYQQHYDMLLKYLRENPGRRHLSTPTLYIDAMLASFPIPCGLPPTIELDPPKR